jgi:enoyl-CoA hydratase/carnithine racemase
MSAALLSTSHGQTMVLTLSNPEQGNALSPDIYAAGIEALGVAESSAEVRSVVIAGGGGRFSAGGHAQQLLANRREPAPLQVLSTEALHNWIESIRTFPKPVIAAVEGSALGAGFSLVLACDLVVAASDASFAMDHGLFGLSPDGGASWSLTQALPRQLAAELLMLGERISAERLHALGIVNRVAAPGASLATALALADQLNAHAPNAIASIKDLLSESGNVTFTTQLGRERDHYVANLHHPNGGIGLTAFLDKTPPRYK